MKIAKEFKWEMGHRLPFHKGKCKNLHGHSYKLMVEFTGDLDENCMVMDYYDVKAVIDPIVEELDHSIMVNKNDNELIKALDMLKSKYVIVDYYTTAENICGYFLDKINSTKLPTQIKSIKVRVYETEATYAEDEINLNE